MLGFLKNYVLNHQCRLDSSQISAGKRWIIKIDDHKKILKKITLKWWHDWFVIFRMTEAEKTQRAFSYSLVSLLDFGFYIQTVWD